MGHSQHRQSNPRCERPVASPGYLELAGPGQLHHLPGTKTDPSAALRVALSPSCRTATQTLDSAFVQSSRRLHYKLVCVRDSGESPAKARTETPQGGARSSGIRKSLGIDTVGGEQVRRRVIATILQGRLADKEAAREFHDGWNGGANRFVSVLPRGGAPQVRTSTGVQRASCIALLKAR